MAHWFHRNPLKATVPLKFEGLKKCAKGAKCMELLTKLKASRTHLVTLVSNPSNEVDDVTVVFMEYLSFLQGLVEAPGGGESKLRSSVMFKWTNTLGGKVPIIRSDAWFEVVSVVMEMAIWHSKHATVVAASDNISLDQAKEVHRSLKLAAGMFLNVKETLLPKLPPTDDKGADTDSRVVEAYAFQSQAEAQEVTLARALELNHKPSIIAQLASETSLLFIQARDSLKTLDPQQFNKWSTYLTLKACVYDAYAQCFFGKDLLAQEKCGESIKVLQHSAALCEHAEKCCQSYARVRGAGTIARPERLPFFQKLSPMVKQCLDKSTRENGFIYYQKVPADLPQMERQQVYGLATPEDFTLPPHHPLWTEETYAAFEVTAESPEKYDTKSSADQEEINPIPEPDVAPAKLPQPKTESGCTVS